MSDAVSRAGQLAEECDRFGLPHDVSALVRHIEGNRAMTEAALAMSNSVLREKLDAAVEENERLREALREIALCSAYLLGFVKAKARAALAPAPLTGGEE